MQLRQAVLSVSLMFLSPTQAFCEICQKKKLVILRLRTNNALKSNTICEPSRSKFQPAAQCNFLATTITLTTTSYLGKNLSL